MPPRRFHSPPRMPPRDNVTLFSLNFIINKWDNQRNERNETKATNIQPTNDGADMHTPINKISW